jgi:BexC/CtrB/KpsE family polysaccharide export inner-membrane protein
MAIVYFGLLSSDVYISESRFIVRTPEKTSASPLGMILSAGGFSSGSEENHAVVDYVRSRNALEDVNRDGFVARIFGARTASVVDRYDGLTGGPTNEQLYRYFNNKVAIELDSSSQITHLTVRAFRPQDARELNERLLQQSEALVNRLSDRGRRDTLVQAQQEVSTARDKARNAVLALARFRNESGIIDPEKQAAINLQMVSKLQDALISDRAELAQVEAYTPRNPQIPALRLRIANLEREIAKQSTQVAGAPTSLSAVASRYQQLQFDADFASKQLALAQTALEEARQDAAKKQAYVERIAQPNLPDYALEPQRWRNVFAVFILGLLCWGVLTTLLAGIREHRD